MNGDLRKPQKPLLELDEALRLIDEAVVHLEDRMDIRPEESLGRITAVPVIAARTIPSFDNSAVDGYAYRFKDGGNKKSFSLRLHGQSLAGMPYTQPLEHEQAVRIATGAKLPEGADTIVMQENCTEAGDTLQILKAPEEGASVRKIGGDFIEGDTVIEAGHLLKPQDIALLSAMGCTKVDVVRPIKIGIFSTGTELRDTGSALQEGQIIDTNGLMLQNLLRRYPADTTLMPRLTDVFEETKDALKDAAQKFDLIITSGGISVGSHDFIRDAIHACGDIFFWRLAIRPGKPVLFGKIGSCLVICLPGNPVSAMVTFFLIVTPVLARLVGQKAQLSPAFLVPLGKSFTKDSHLRHFARAHLEQHDNVWKALPYRDQSSNLLGSLVGTDGLLDLPTGQSDFPEGMLVHFRPFSGLAL